MYRFSIPLTQPPLRSCAVNLDSHPGTRVIGKDMSTYCRSHISLIKDQSSACSCFWRHVVFHVLSPNVAFQLPTHQLNLYTPWILSQCGKNGFQRTWDQTRTRCHLSSNVVSGNSSDGPWFSGKWSQRSRNVIMFKGFQIPIFIHLLLSLNHRAIGAMNEDNIQHFQNRLVFSLTTSKPPCWRHHPVAPELNFILAKGPRWFCVARK